MEQKLTQHAWALTGGIACGKSTVEGIFKELGAVVLDADQISREVLQLGSPYLAKFLTHFEGLTGVKLRKEDGSLDRAVLRELMLQKESLRVELENFLHPLIQRESLKKMSVYWDAYRGCFERLVIYSAALIFEKKRENDFKGVILVTVSPAIQKERLMLRDNMSSQLAEGMIQIQSQDREREHKSKFVIQNDGNIEKLRAQVKAVYEQIHAPRVLH